MLAKVSSGATLGLSAVPIDIEVDVASQGLPSFTIVGLPDKAVEESRERVRSAIKNSGGDFPVSRITVNLAPADLPKVGPAYDLPIALGILIASGQIQAEIAGAIFFGELSLDGSLRHTNSILPITYLAKQKGYKNIFIPKMNAKEASVVPGVNIMPGESLIELVRHFTGVSLIEAYPRTNIEDILENSPAEFDFAEIIGQEAAKRALEVAAAGGHNVFMKGSPGSGKTMLARAFPGILPRLTEEEALEVTKIYSITGNLSADSALVTARPFRAPHHTTSRIGLIGGGSNPAPGEVSLAHRGILFLDEFPEFPRNVMEALRQPMEDGKVSISRARAAVTYPAKFILVAAANPCPCGYYNDPKKPCKCLPGTISRYEKRISGPILDRIDIHLEVPSVETQKLIKKADPNAERSQSVQARVQRARDIQSRRFKNHKIASNAEMGSAQVREFADLSPESLTLLKEAVNTMNLSARGYFKVVKVSRTIADLAGEEKILPQHVAEALQYRPREN